MEGPLSAAMNLTDLILTGHHAVLRIGIHQDVLKPYFLWYTTEVHPDGGALHLLAAQRAQHEGRIRGLQQGHRGYKVGGAGAAGGQLAVAVMRLAAAVKENGMRMRGCKLHSSIGVAAGLHEG